jgi:hypothetical protein
MAYSNVMPAYGARLGGFVARHPRLVAALLALTLLLAVQDGAVAADGTFTEPTAEAAVDPGPDPDND